MAAMPRFAIHLSRTATKVIRRAEAQRPHNIATVAAGLVYRVGGEDREFGDEAAVVHFESGFYGVGDVFGPEFGVVDLLREVGGGEEVGDHFAGVDKDDADVEFAEFGAPAFGHAAEGELAGVVGGAVGSAAETGGGGNVDDVAALAGDEVFGGFPGHEHGAGDVGGEGGFEALEIEVDEVLEDAAAGVVDQDVEFAEFLQDFAIGALYVFLVGDVGLDWMHA